MTSSFVSACLVGNWFWRDGQWFVIRSTAKCFFFVPFFSWNRHAIKVEQSIYFRLGFKLSTSRIRRITSNILYRPSRDSITAKPVHAFLVFLSLGKRCWMLQTLRWRRSFPSMWEAAAVGHRLLWVISIGDNQTLICIDIASSMMRSGNGYVAPVSLLSYPMATFLSNGDRTAYLWPYWLAHLFRHFEPFTGCGRRFKEKQL